MPEYIGRPPIKKFTKTAPCSTHDVWLCFTRGEDILQYTVQVDMAHSIIGTNTPDQMQRSGKLRRVNGVVDNYVLTEQGYAWLVSWKEAYDRKKRISKSS